MNTEMAELWLMFVQERHRIWQQRQAGAPQPWTTDPILTGYKFTNMFRVLDPGSQFVFELADPELSERDVLARLVLYRYTNTPALWRHLRDSWRGEYPAYDDMNQGLIDQIHEYKDAGNVVFNGCYVVPPPYGPGDKTEQVITMVRDLVTNSWVGRFLALKNQEDRFYMLRANKGTGDFLAMQILTDWGYTPHCGADREAEMVVQGPGSVKGAKHIMTNERYPIDILRWGYEQFQFLGPELPSGRPLSLMDVQNTLCEFSKYVRYRDALASGQRPPKPYTPAHPGPQPAPVLPGHW